MFCSPNMLIYFVLLIQFVHSVVEGGSVCLSILYILNFV